MMNAKSVALALLALLLIEPQASPGAPNDTSARQGEKGLPVWKMTTYYMGLLRRGPRWSPEVTPEIERLQAEHMAHIKSMADSGSLVAAGPMRDNVELRGIFLFKTDSYGDARALAGADPAVKAGRLVVELHPWYGPAGIGDKYAEAARKGSPPTAMATYYFCLLHRGPKWTAESTPETERLQAAHLGWINDKAKSGKLVAAGPFTDDVDVLGVFIFDVESIEEAQALANTDPTVQSGRLKPEIHPWFAAKGLFDLGAAQN